MRKKVLILLFAFLLPFKLFSDTGISGASEVNKCEINTYTITIENTSSQPITNIVVHNYMPTPGFSYVSGSSSLSVSGGGCSSTADPTINGNELIWDIDSLCGSAVNIIGKSDGCHCFSDPVFSPRQIRKNNRRYYRGDLHRPGGSTADHHGSGIKPYWISPTEKASTNCPP